MLSGQRMLLTTDIPIIGCRQPTLFLLLALSFGSLLIGVTVYGKSIDNDNGRVNGSHIGKHPVYFSEYKLRSSIETFNGQLRQLKKDFVKQITGSYLSMKSDPTIGVESAKKGNAAAIVSTLLAEEFAQIVIRKHVIQRRLLSGLKVAFVKFLPMETLKKLIEKFDSYSWLKSQSQVDLRPKFPAAKENQYVQLYTLIELRARVRATDDVITLTADNIKRILKIVQLYLIEKKPSLPVDGAELDLISHHARKILSFYNSEVIESQKLQSQAYERQLKQASSLAQSVGGEAEFLKLIDRIINAEVLDIDLNSEANSLDLPPTISESMISNVQADWIPKRVLESVDEDRELLLKNDKLVKHLASLESELSEVDVGAWSSNAALHLAKDRSYY